MPRRFGGHTPLGQELNNLGSKTSEGVTERHSQKIGTIIAYAVQGSDNNKIYRSTDPKADGMYRFIVRLQNGKETGFLPFAGTANEQAALKGHPSAFLGKSCLIVFKGHTSNRGVILNIIDDYSDGESTGASNQLQITGAAFAPPGNGLI